MTTLVSCTEVQEMEIDSSDPIIRFEISTNAEDETENILQLELLDHVEDILGEFSRFVGLYLDVKANHRSGAQRR